MMLENECLCMFFEMLSWRESAPLCDNYSDGDIESWTIKGRRSRAHLRWAWNGNGHELLALLVPNKNG
jgi:hypothetical protein